MKKRINFHIGTVILILLLLACKESTEKNRTGIEPETTKTGSVTIDSIIFNYTVKGTGTPFLLVGSDPEYFSEGFFNNFRLYSVDTRLNAKENEPIDPTGYTINNTLNNIEVIRAKLGLEKFVIGGHSVMGAVAYKYAKVYPEFVSHIVLLGTPRTFGTSEYKNTTEVYWQDASEHRRMLYDENQIQLKEENKKQLSTQEYFKKSLVASGPKRWHDATLDATTFFERVHYNLGFFNHFFSDVIPEYDLCSDIEYTNIPIFLAIGKSDYIGPPTLWDTDCKNLTGLSIFQFEKSGHTPHYEQSELFNKRLIDWLKKRD